MTALTLDFFRSLKQGDVVVLHYNLYNKGTFTWVHDHTDPKPMNGFDTHSAGRVWGRFIYEGGNLNDFPVDSYLYECDGVVCRGSAAEPLHLEMPEDPVWDDEEDWVEEGR